MFFAVTDLSTLLLLIGLGFVAMFFASSLKAREIGVAAARRACDQDGLLFLDDSVALQRTRLLRNTAGQLCLARRYAFEYSDTGNNRLPGFVSLQGHKVLAVDMLLRAAREEA